MMDKTMVKKLSSADVDPAVIISLLLDEDEPEQAAEVRAEPAQPEQAAEVRAEPAQPDQAPAAAEIVPQAPAPQPEPRKDDAILAAIERLTGAIHASNIRGASAGNPSQAETADQILAQVISAR